MSVTISEESVRSCYFIQNCNVQGLTNFEAF